MTGNVERISDGARPDLPNAQLGSERRVERVHAQHKDAVVLSETRQHVSDSGNHSGANMMNISSTPTAFFCDTHMNPADVVAR